MNEDRRRVTIGSLISETFSVLMGQKGLFLLYLVVFVPLATLGNIMDGDELDGVFRFRNGNVGTVVFLVSVLGHYWLFAKITPGSSGAENWVLGRVAGFFGLAFLTYLATGLASLLLVLPGLFVGSRLLMSPAIYAGDRTGVFSAMSKSWDHTRGSTLHVALTISFVMIVLIILGSISGSMNFSINSSSYQLDLGLATFGHFVRGLASELVSIILIAMSIAAYRSLIDHSQDLVDTFA